MFQCGTKRNYCPAYASLAHQTAVTQNGTGVPLATYVAILSRGTAIMLKSKNLAPGNATRCRTALAIGAATLFIGGGNYQNPPQTQNKHHYHPPHSLHQRKSR